MFVSKIVEYLRAVSWVVAVMATVLVTAPALAAEPAPRLALVIANSDYAGLPDLPNAARDGDTVSAAPTRANSVDASGGAPVRPRRNLTAETLRAEIAQFREA